MTNVTIVWVLRFAAFPFLAGLAMMAAGGYALFVCAPSVDASAPWVPAAFALGDFPWIGTLAFGWLLVLYAWRTGFQARRGSI